MHLSFIFSFMGIPSTKVRRGFIDYIEQEGSNRCRMPAPRNGLAGTSKDLLPRSLTCANFAKLYPLFRMICHHSKNRLTMWK